MASLAVLAPSPLLRAGLAALLSTMGFEPVEEAADLNELKRRATDVRRPEILLISLPERDEGPAPLIQEIKAWAPHAKVVLLAPELDMPALSACFGAGAAGYLLEDISRDGLQHSLRLVSAGENVFPSDLASALSLSTSKLSGPVNTVEELRNLHATDREIDILRCIAKGESNSLIGKKLDISEAEVSAHIKHILRKLRVTNRTQAALWGVARGLAAPFASVTQLAENTEGEETQMNLKDSPASQMH
jgi:two-component system, NarL family, nitrate/nitrite response regulator NarL